MPEILAAADRFIAYYGRDVGAFEFRMWLAERKLVVYAPWDRPPDG